MGLIKNMQKQCDFCSRTIGFFSRQAEEKEHEGLCLCNNCYESLWKKQTDIGAQAKHLAEIALRNGLKPEKKKIVVAKVKELHKEEEEKKSLIDYLIKHSDDSKMNELLSKMGFSSSFISAYKEYEKHPLASFSFLDFGVANQQKASLDCFHDILRYIKHYGRFEVGAKEEKLISELSSYMEERKRALIQPLLDEMKKAVNDKEQIISIPKAEYEKDEYGPWFYITIPIASSLSRWMKASSPLSFDKIYIESEDIGKNSVVYKYSCLPRHSISGYSSPVSFSRNDDEEQRFLKVKRKVNEIVMFEKNKETEQLNASLGKVLLHSLNVNELSKAKKPEPPNYLISNNIDEILNQFKYVGELNLNVAKPLSYLEKRISDARTQFLLEIDENYQKRLLLASFLAKDNHRIELLNNELDEEYKYKLRCFEHEKKVLETSYCKDNSRTKKAIEEFIYSILSSSLYPTQFKKTIIVEFDENTGRCIIEYQLPTERDVPAIKEYKYKPFEDQIIEIREKPSELARKWTLYAYSVCLRSINEVFTNNETGEIASIVFNGWLQNMNSSTGQNQNSCILSIHIERDAFHNLDIQRVDPIACFKSLKGVSAAQLADIVPIQPIQTVDMNDKRFIEAYEVAGSLKDSTNLAAMDWQDFEHLIREVFEKEFCENGSEVKITQSSRDGGVDAVVFDNDPIRGGKIVIQAKRYTNTVGVSAVRDLFGTIINEGAMKGILVTTSDFGSDSYAFAKDKPITLLSGGNLLFLLNKHGYHAKIDLEEAKKLETRR